MRLGLFESMKRILSTGKWDVGSARRLSVCRSRSIGDDHLNGVCCNVRVRSFGKVTALIMLELGSQGHSAKKPASALETSNSFNRGASPSKGISDNCGRQIHRKGFTVNSF